MKKLLDLGNTYASESTWKDYALVKFCLFALGLIAGTQVPKRFKKPVIIGAVCIFLATYVPLMVKVFTIALRDDEEDFEDIFEDEWEA